MQLALQSSKSRSPRRPASVSPVFDDRFRSGGSNAPGRRPSRGRGGGHRRASRSTTAPPSTAGTSNDEMEAFFDIDLKRSLCGSNDRMLYLKMVSAEGFDTGLRNKFLSSHPEVLYKAIGFPEL